MIIAFLNENDLDAIEKLYKKDFSDGWNKSMLLSSFRGGRFVCFGAFIDQVLIGVITITLGLDDADIEGIVVDSNFRRKGVADKLLNHTLNYIKGLNIDKTILEVRASNLPSIQLYFKHGFRQISIRKKYYPDGEDALILIKEI